MRTLTEQIKLKSERNSATGCWLWTGARNTHGYGELRVGRKIERAHRIAYEVFRGPIPHGLTIDHVCRNRACVNPAHLEAVTHKDNCLRGMSLWAENAKKVACVRGHLFTPENTRLSKRGTRQCRECERIRHRSYAH